MNKGTEMQTERPKICTSLLEMRQISALCKGSYAGNLKIGANIAKKWDYHNTGIITIPQPRSNSVKYVSLRHSFI